MKKKILIILGVIIVIITALVAWQWNNIMMIRSGLTKTEEQLLEEKAESEKQAEEAISSLGDITVRDLTDEEKEALNSGELSQEEAIAIMTGKADSESPSGTASESPSGTAAPAASASPASSSME